MVLCPRPLWSLVTSHWSLVHELTGLNDQGGQYGLAEGRIISLAHPVVMGGCFLLSLGSAYTGYQWRRIRDIGAEITDLKATLKGPKAALDTLKAIEEPTAADTAKISSLSAEVGPCAR